MFRAVTNIGIDKEKLLELKLFAVYQTAFLPTLLERFAGCVWKPAEVRMET